MTQEEINQQMFDKERYYDCRIRPDDDHPEYVTERVYVNGVMYQLEVGKELRLPKTIYDMLVTRGII